VSGLHGRLLGGILDDQWVDHIGMLHNLYCRSLGKVTSGTRICDGHSFGLAGLSTGSFHLRHMKFLTNQMIIASMHFFTGEIHLLTMSTSPTCMWLMPLTASWPIPLYLETVQVIIIDSALKNHFLSLHHLRILVILNKCPSIQPPTLSLQAAQPMSHVISPQIVAHTKTDQQVHEETDHEIHSYANNSVFVSKSSSTHSFG